MRILTVSAFFESHGGGIEIVAGALARALGRRGHDSRLAASALDPAPADDGLVAVPLAARDPIEAMTGLPMPLLQASARRRLEQEVREADALVIHDALYSTSLLARRYAERHGKPWILIQHIGAIPYTNPLLRLAMATANRFVARPFIGAAPQVVFISSLVREHFSADLHPGRHLLMFNGVDHGLFRPPDGAERERLRKEFGLATERRQLLFVGRFVEKKGLAALHALAVRRPDWDIQMVGSGPLDPSRWALPNVHVLGRKSRAELAELYRAADALTLPSVGEGFPLVIQEAMASGLPVFCGLDSAAADPHARNLLHGIEVIPGKPEATAAHLARAILSVPSGVNLAAAEHARASYDWDRNACWVAERLRDLQASNG